MKQYIAILKNNPLAALLSFVILFIQAITVFPNGLLENNGDYQLAKLYWAVLLLPVSIIFFIKSTHTTENISKLQYLPLLIPLAGIIQLSVTSKLIIDEGITDLLTYLTAYIYTIFFVSCVKRANLITVINQTFLLIAIAILSKLYFDLLFGPEYLRFNLTGNNNLTAYYLLIGIIIFTGYKCNFKFLFILASLVAIIILLKARVPSLLAILFLASTIIFSAKNKKNKVVILLMLIVVSSPIFFLDRFSSLLSFDIYIRLYSWARFFDALQINTLLFGIGPGYVPIAFNENKNIFPIVDVLMGADTHRYAHMYLIDLIYNYGFIAALIFFVPTLLLLMHYKKFMNSDYKWLYIAYLMTIIISFYDVTLNNFSTLLVFFMMQGVLLTNLYNFQKSNLLSTLITLFCFSIIMWLSQATYFKSYPSVFVKYKELIHKINAKRDIQTNLGYLNILAPNFGNLATINAYNYVFNRDGSFDEDIFSRYISDAERFDKYQIRRLHLSSQYYAFKGNAQSLIMTYDDIYYSNIIRHRLLPFKRLENYKKLSIYDGSNIIIGSDLSVQIPKSIFFKIAHVNSANYQTNYIIAEREVWINNAVTDRGIPINDLQKRQLNLFFDSILEYSKPLVFNK